MKLKGFADVPWDSVFGRFLLEKKYGDVTAPHSTSYWMKKILHSIFYPSIVFDKTLAGHPVLFFSSFTGRKSIVDNFLKVKGLVPSDLIIKANYKPRIDFRNALRLFFLSFSWNESLKHYRLTRPDRYSMVYETLKVARLHDILVNLNLREFKLLVTFNDSFTLESYAVEFFRLSGIKTASLQHGQFISWRADTFFDCGIEFKTFKSDYFLCWNKYTYDEAIKFGIAPEKLVVTGIWSYIGVKREKCRQNHNGVFGVVIGHPSWEAENQVMIEAANLLSEKNNLKYYLKLHPNYQEHAYDSKVNERFVGIIPKGISMMDYANVVDFSLVGSSSVFTELVFIGHGIYRYSSGEANDKYSEVKVGSYFNTPEQLLSLYEQGGGDNDSDALFDYLCTVSDVAQSYTSFFKQFEH